MTDYNALVDELTVTTYKNKKAKWYDNLTASNVLLSTLKKKGKITEISGGTQIERDIYAPVTNSNYKRYSGFEPFFTNVTDGITAVQYDWRQAATSVVMAGRDILVNTGTREKAKDFVDAKLNIALKDAENKFNADTWSDGTAANQMGGIQFLITDTGGGTVGGINSTTYTWWKNIVQSAAAPLQGGSAITPNATTIESLMRPLYNRLRRGGDKTDLIVSALDYYEFYEASVREDKRFMGEKMADAGFASLFFMGIPVVLENSANTIPSSHMYFINTNYLELVTMKGRNWAIQKDRVPTNQDGVVKPILWMGNMICTNRSLQGVLKA